MHHAEEEERPHTIQYQARDYPTALGLRRQRGAVRRRLSVGQRGSVTESDLITLGADDHRPILDVLTSPNGSGRRAHAIHGLSLGVPAARRAPRPTGAAPGRRLGVRVTVTGTGRPGLRPRVQTQPGRACWQLGLLQC